MNSRVDLLNSEALVSIEGLSHYYGPLAALNAVDYDIYPGAFNALLGANGAGKSTVLKAIMGLAPVY